MGHLKEWATVRPSFGLIRLSGGVSIAAMVDWHVVLQSDWAKLTGTAAAFAAVYKFFDEWSKKRRERTRLTFKILDEWREAQFTKDRHYIATVLTASLKPEQIERGIRGLTTDDQERFNRVSYFLDYLGHLLEFGLVDERVVLVMIGSSVKQLWEKAGPLIKAERAIKRKGHQGGFEHIALLAEEKPNSLEMHHMSKFDHPSMHPVLRFWKRNKLFLSDDLRRYRIKKNIDSLR